MRIPTRTCIGCGVRAARPELIRVVAVGDEIVPDSAGPDDAEAEAEPGPGADAAQAL